MPPKYSTRQLDVNTFYDNILASIYEYQDIGTVFICGDFNSRIGDTSDFIEGIDNVPNRDIVDFTCNEYGSVLIDFLVNSNYCVLNGRNCTKNDFTCVRPQGSSVVDYCLVSHKDLSIFKECHIYRSSELVNRTGVAPVSVPDHSFITWSINLTCSVSDYSANDQSENTFVKYDVKTIPNNFLQDPKLISDLHNTVFNLESSSRTQQDIDNSYKDLCELIKHDMSEKLHKRIIILNSASSNKRRKVGKPWWDDNLTILWNKVCSAETLYLKCYNICQKKALRIEFLKSRKAFNREMQKSKRLYWFKMQNDLLYDIDKNSCNFWRSIGKIGVAFQKKNKIPMEVIDDNGDIINDNDSVLLKWKNSFSDLYNTSTNNSILHEQSNDNVTNTNSVPEFEDEISIFEMHKAIFNSKKEKASGIDGLPSEIFRNNTSVSFLHVLFNVCFNTGVIPTEWGKGIVNPIPKSSTNDPRDPMSYRGITIAPSMYKLYCYVLNQRLSSWTESNDKIADEQNGFRKQRSTTDHISSLTNIIETRIKQKLSTFTAFVDFKKAYDTVNRNILWKKLCNLGINGKMLKAIKSLYASVSSCVRINGLKTDWFDVKTGLRQGCCLSPLLFNCFINDFACKIKALDVGIDIGNESKVCIMLYADDIVLLAESETDLQLMLNTLSEWCETNYMSINSSKTNVIHFRPRSKPKTNFIFKCGDLDISIAEKYIYLGLTLDEFLNFNITASFVAQSASRALGLLIAKYKALGGMPYKVYTKLYDSLVWSIVAYGAAIWGTQSFSCIEAVQNRAMRAFLGTPRNTPSAAMAGDMAWQPVCVRQLTGVSKFWFRLNHMHNARFNKQTFLCCFNVKGPKCKNWSYRVINNFAKIGCDTITNMDNAIEKSMINKVINSCNNKYMTEWKADVNLECSKNSSGGNKLRTYKLFKSCFEAENYCKMILPRSHRSALSKFRCGNAPIRLETGRYERLPVCERVCPFCNGEVEDEVHVILKCPLYDDIRSKMINDACILNSNFSDYTDKQKLVFLFSTSDLIRICAKTCFLILQRRSSHLYR